MKTIDTLEGEYLDAAADLKSKQAGLQNYADELEVFLAAKERLKSHPNFSGKLPETYYTGGDLDPGDSA